MKRPSFQFYPKDWLSDPNVISMTATERGAYIQLLATMWTTADCQLRDDIEYLSRVAHVDKVVITSLYPCFKVVNGWLRHKRLDFERKKQDEYRSACSEAGKRGMANRWNRTKKDKVVITKHNSSSSSSTSSATAVKKEEASNHASEIMEVISYLNEKADRTFEAKGVNSDLVRARLNEGYDLGKLKGVVDVMVLRWKTDPKMKDYLRPSTLFGKEKFAQYVGLVGENNQIKKWI